MIRFLIILWALFNSLAADHAIVFVHLGPKLPSYLEAAIAQARLFNTCPIYVIANEEALQQVDNEQAIWIPAETLPLTNEHQQFRKVCKHPPGLWSYSSERFLVLYDLMKCYKLENIIHMENDIMLYVDLENLLPIFLEHYPGLAATFDNDERCIPSFLYIRNKEALKLLAEFFAHNFQPDSNDMKIIAQFKNKLGEPAITSLPIIMPSYAERYKLISPHGHIAKNPSLYSRHFDLFHSIFDAAALGQYLGGIDPHYHGANAPGFINESCVFNPARMTYEWRLDEQGRKIPFAHFQGEAFRINNLHIHCKDLKKFFSGLIK